MRSYLDIRFSRIHICDKCGYQTNVRPLNFPICPNCELTRENAKSDIYYEIDKDRVADKKKRRITLGGSY